MNLNFGFKISKAYVFCGAVLASLCLGMDRVAADETAATNLKELQPQASSAHSELIQESGQDVGQLMQPIVSEELEQAQVQAQAAGVVIEQKAPRFYDSLAKAQEDLQQQAQSLLNKTASQQALQREITSIQAQNQQILQVNQAEIERVSLENQENETQIKIENQREQDRVDLENTRLQNRYKQDLENYERLRNDRQETLKTIQTRQQEVEQAKRMLVRPDDISYGSNGYTKSNSTQHLKLSAPLKGMKLIAKGDLKNPQVLVEGEIPESQIVTSFVWKNVEPEGPELTKGVYGDKSYWDAAYNYNQNGTTTQIWTGRIGNWYKIPEAIKTADGKIHDAYIQVEIDSSGLYKESMWTKTDGTYFAFWNQDGAINTLNGFTLGSVNQKSDGIRLRVRLDSPKNTTPYLWATTIYDLDLGQFLEVDPKTSQILSIGGGLKVEGSKIVSDENLGNTYGLNRDVNALNARASSPDGAVLLAQYTSEYQSMIRNSPGGAGSSVARADFGAAGQVQIQVIPKLPPEPEKPTKPTLLVPNFKTFIPKIPSPKPLHPVPDLPTKKESVHPVFVIQKPSNHKTVVNQAKMDVDGKLVPKGSLQIWELQNQPLKAGRDQVFSYQLKDPLPSGFLVDWAKTKEMNQVYWTVTEKSADHLIFEAKAETLSLLNKNRHQAISLPLAYVIGRPQNDGGSYRNTFKTMIQTPSGSFVTVSNTSVIYTPGQDPKHPRTGPNGDNPTPEDNFIHPQKEVFNPATGQTLNGRSLLPNSKIYYRLTQDFDQYKGIQVSPADISKGFYFVEDYPDDRLDPTSLKVTAIKSSNGEDLSQLLNYYHVLTPHSIDSKLQKALEHSGVRPHGAYLLWSAKDPQAFFERYVQAGLSVTYDLSFSLDKKFKEGAFTNQAFQVEFGNGYASNHVGNEVPTLKVQKEVLNQESEQDLNGHEVAMGQLIRYRLKGWEVPANRGYKLEEYRFLDNLDQEHDTFVRGQVVSAVTLTLQDGRMIPSGTDLTEFVDQVYEGRDGHYSLAFKKDFLETLSDQSPFAADVYLTVKRISSGTVRNQYTLVVNGNPVDSQLVQTHTSVPDSVNTEFLENGSQKPEKTLPYTGTEGDHLSFIGNMMMGLAALIVALKKNKS
ncbi:SspB-related isopeptide-forming adhesin [Streptococcus sp. NLN64]|uniref:SspB-related isopeptide-forming adhesin n=1 Tax=Streptococcus sp. NLN64 TaxID=2822799 RepID=UPI0018C90154|nr:SspB-related isopeptide-forming adhesin [Streptococcus sp. NLN64]MBG9366817.1 LPXTG cell wall anchor domain-containing protein [Streptococcus sp. NLN64]